MLGLYTWVNVLTKDRRGQRSPGARVTGRCELPDVGAGHQIQVFWKDTLLSLTTQPSLHPQILLKLRKDGM